MSTTVSQTHMFGSPCESRPRAQRRPVLVLGVGNVLRSDEGVGVHVVEAMREVLLPGDAEVFDGGTAGLDLLDVISDRRKVIVIDAVQAEHEPGSILRLRPEDLGPDMTDSLSLHEAGFMSALRAAALLSAGPDEVVLFGVRPKEVGWGLKLSDAVAAQVPRIIDLVLAELGGGVLKQSVDPMVPANRKDGMS